MPESTSALIGYSGFVGGNLDAQHEYTDKFNSKNIDQIDGKSFDVVVSSATRAEMWIANQNPEEDMAGIQNLIDHLSKIKAGQFVLISTVAVYPVARDVDEDSQIDVTKATPYGVHRFKLEEFVKANFENCLIVRLPGLFGPGLKKNIVYDFLHNNNVDRIDSRAVYQLYNLGRIWSDISVALENNLDTLNLAVEPTSVAEVAKAAFGLDFDQHTLPDDKLPNYDMHTTHADLFGQSGDYLASKASVLADLKKFVEHEKSK